MRKDEKQLIADLLDRKEEAFHMFYQTHAPKVRNFIRKRIGNEKDVEEILQDTLFAFLERVRDFNGGSKLSTYLCAIARHKIVDYYRKKRIKQTVFSQLPEGLIELFSFIVTPEKELDRTFLKEKIEKALSHLEPRYKTILLLKYKEGYSVSEIAGKLSCSFKSAESALFRARKAFRYEFRR